MVRVKLKRTYADKGSLISLIKWHNSSHQANRPSSGRQLNSSAADFSCEMATLNILSEGHLTLKTNLRSVDRELCAYRTNLPMEFG